MKTTSFRQKFGLLAFGLLLTFVILEAGLRLAGVLVLYLQERHNHLSFDPNEYRILCLGESTTALGGEDSYPSQLQEMLNAKLIPKKFSLINKGIISTTTNTILAQLDRNLNTYKPKLVIVMMGINDRVYLHDTKKVLWWESLKYHVEDLRTVKLVRLLYAHITHRASRFPKAGAEEISPVNENDPQQLENFLKFVMVNSIQSFTKHSAAASVYAHNHQYTEATTEIQLAQKSLNEAGLAAVELARRLRLQGLFPQAQNILQQAVSFAPKNAAVYQEWGELYLEQDQGEPALKAFQTAFDLDPKNSEVLLGLARAWHQQNNDNAFIFYNGYLQNNPQDYWGYIELARWLREAKHYGPAQSYLEQAIKINATFDDAFVDLGEILGNEGQDSQEEALYLKEITAHPQSTRLYQALGQFYEKHGKADLAQEYFQKAASHQMPEYCPATLVNYKLLVDKILSRHIQVIIMQYPLRSIGILKDYLGNRNGVIFVENKQNFKKALSEQAYSYYFKDNFAYDFGHCTRAGNELIARQLSDVISIWMKKSRLTS
jgi:tetratricopeptide (TPR) repeat protein